MLLVIAALALLVTVPLAGGRLSRLVDIQIHAVWAVLLAVAIQVGISNVAPGGSHVLHAGLNVLSYVLDAYFIFANRRLAGVPLVATGAALNVLAITSNGGVMPANAVALRTAGITARAGFDNSAALAHPHLAFLGDVFPVPGPWPIGNVLSAGDVIILLGALVLLHVTCRSRLFAPRATISRDARGSTARI
jgi:Family of unknown function (DUF5317)